MAKARNMLRRIWEIAREVVGDKAYDRYAQHVRARGEVPLTPGEFYVSQLQRKYTRPCRCC
jgi:uncharacterized short protein YbdD (DUF466 family)